MVKLDQLHDRRGAVVGVPTGFTDLDRLTGGLQRSDLIILAARPAIGKTSLALSLAHNAAIGHKHAVAVFSLEMSKEQLVQRLLSMDAGVDQQRLRTGWIEDDEWERLEQAGMNLSEANLWIDDTASISTMEMRSKARRLQAEVGIDLIIVDYLQLMQSTIDGKRNDNRVQEVSEISRNLKGLARELDVPVMALAQLSRTVESRQSKVPQLSDLRESGCLTGGTLVYLPDEGIYKRIDALVSQKNFNVLALNPETWKLESKLATNAFSTGRKPVYTMTTRLGRTIRATANHKFLTFGGWKRLDEISTGARIALPRTLPGPKKSTMTLEELALLGHLIGNGCTLPRHAIQYTTIDEDLAHEVAQLATKVFGEKITPRINWETPKARKGGWYQVYLASSARLTHGVRNPIAVWMDNLGVYGLRSYEKFIPACVFSQSNEGAACFLRHLWATDGHASCSANRLTPALYYATSSCRMASEIQSLLLRLSINARIARVPQGQKGRAQYHIVLSGKPDLERFITNIGIAGQRKQQMLEQVHNHIGGRVINTNRDIIPRQAWREMVVPAMVLISITARQMQTGLEISYNGTALYKSHLGRERAARVATLIKSEQLELLSQSDVYWDRVVSIVEDGEEEVYDLTVDSHHNFIANDVIVHNSIEQDADVVMFIYRDDVYNPDTDRKNIADIIVAKHRNGPVGEVSLYFQANQTRFRDLEVTPPAEE
jgi:replicative DNA helicase